MIGWGVEANGTHVVRALEEVVEWGQTPTTMGRSGGICREVRDDDWVGKYAIPLYFSLLQGRKDFYSL